VNGRAQAHLRSMSKGRASRRAKSHQTMTQAKSRAVDRKSTMFQADLKYDKNEPCSNHGGDLVQSEAEHDRQHAWPEQVTRTEHSLVSNGRMPSWKVQESRRTEKSGLVLVQVDGNAKMLADSDSSVNVQAAM